MRHVRDDVVAIVRGDTFETADRHGLFVDASAPTRRLTWAIARSTEHAGKDVRVPVDHIGLGVTAFGDQPDVLGHRRVSRASVLAIDNFVKVFGILNVCWFQVALSFGMSVYRTSMIDDVRINF